MEKQECTIWLQCAVCDDRFQNVTKANEHFLAAHKSHNLNFKAITLVKRTTKEGVTSCYTCHDDRQTYSCKRDILCHLCERKFTTMADIVDHFNHDHPKEEIALKPGPINIDKIRNKPRHEYINFGDDNLVYYCMYCRDGWKTGESNRRTYKSIYKAHAHWHRTHANSNESKPFRFYAIEFVLCVHCKFIGSFDAVRQHTKAKHPNELLTISSVVDPNACALCQYVGDNLGQHIKSEHELVLRTDTVNPTRFNDETLKRLLNAYVYWKFKCLYCEQIYESEESVKAHSEIEHLHVPMAYTKCTDDDIKLVAGCCGATLELHEFLDHVADPNHVVGAVCSRCNFQTNDTFEFVNHQVQTHKMTKDASYLYRRVMLTKFWATKVIFGNGLVVTKHNLLNTEWDDSTPFISLIEKLLAVAHERLNIKNVRKEFAAIA